MDEQQLLNNLNELINQLNVLENWSYSNSRKLNSINQEFLANACSLLELIGRNPAGFVMQQDDTTTEVGRSQGPSTQKTDADFCERYYNKAVRHLRDEIPEFINTYNRYKLTAGNQ